MTVNHKSGEPLYKQLADLLRNQIETGIYPPGVLIPAEATLAENHNVCRETTRQAISVLRNEGLVSTTRGQGTRVRVNPGRTQVVIGHDDRVIARMPTSQERHALRLDDGVPIFEIRRVDGRVEHHPGNGFHIVYRRDTP